MVFNYSQLFSTSKVLQAQRISVITNQDTIANMDTVFVIPYNINYTFGDSTIKISKGTFTYIVKLANKKSNTVTSAFSKILNTLGQDWRKTLTYDNGVEMAYQQNLTAKTGMDVYFAQPYSSWERDTNENTNGLIRRYLPKGTIFHEVTEEQLKDIQNKLNNRPRKILGHKTPLEAMEQCA